MLNPDHPNPDELHWLLGILQDVDVGMVVLDRNMRIQLWNGFMVNHSGMAAEQVMQKNLFALFPELPEAWLVRKIESVFLLNNRAFSTWQQRPYLFRFENYHPITGGAAFMYQNLSIIPLESRNGEVDQVCLILYDVTDIAMDEMALQVVNKQLEKMSSTDGLTQLYNRHTWENLLASEYKRYCRSHGDAVLVMFDIDHFKRINDGYGHQAGDEVIRRVSDLLRQAKRESDIAGRYGGEEFGVILVDTNITGGLEFAERFRQLVEKSVVYHEGQALSFTISIGLRQHAILPKGYEQWLLHCDQALYHAKQHGRNRVSNYTTVMSNESA